MKPIYLFPLLTLAFANAAWGMPYTPEVRQQGEARYVIGGVGQEEVEAINAMAKDFDAKVILSDTKGHYLSDAEVTVKNANGETVISTKADGPILLIDVKPGAYTVEAKYNNSVQHKTVKVDDRTKGKTVHFTWRDDDEENRQYSGSGQYTNYML